MRKALVIDGGFVFVWVFYGKSRYRTRPRRILTCVFLCNFGSRNERSDRLDDHHAHTQLTFSYRLDAPQRTIFAFFIGYI